MTETINVGLLYAAALVGLLLICWRLLAKVAPASVQIFLLGTLAIALATPTAVPETQSLAPAWLVSLFELAVGRAEVSELTVRPLILAMTVFYALFLMFYLVRSILRRRAIA